MDPLTQGVLGAAAAQAAMGSRVPRAWLVGLVSGMAADLDVFIRSDTDPLLAIEYHRHFTHALAFIPVGAVVAALPFLLTRRGRENARGILLASLAAYATHGLLDACTSYGTQLLWPFSSMRVAWDAIAIIDPVFTLTLIAGVVVAAIAGTAKAARVGLALAVVYLGLGFIQRERAESVQEALAAARGHERVRGEVFPTLANQLVWRSLYREGDRLHVDRIRVPWFGAPSWSPGATVVAVDAVPQSDDPRIARDFGRFAWFSNGWVARAPSDESVFGDVRYSLRTDSFEPIWGIRLHPNAAVPVEWVSRTRDRELRLATLWSEIRGTDKTYRGLPR